MSIGGLQNPSLHFCYASYFPVIYATSQRYLEDEEPNDIAIAAKNV